ncbi:hypothetical protein NECAME_19505, partial [Necator americanus]
TNITLHALRVEASKVSIIQRKVRLEKYLFKNLGRVKGISNAEDPKQKLFMFDPNLVNEDSHELKEQIEKMIKEYAGDIDLRWEPRTVQITFEDWDLRRILKAVLPKELDFRTVVNKIDGITNEYRNFELDLLAGDADYVTEVTEDGFMMLVLEWVHSFYLL